MVQPFYWRIRLEDNLFASLARSFSRVLIKLHRQLAPKCSSAPKSFTSFWQTQ